MIFADRVVGAHNGARLGALDVHFDEIDAIELQLGNQLVDGRQRDALDLFAALAVNEEAVGRRVLRIDLHGHDLVFIPNAFGINNDAPGGNLVFEIPAEAFNVFGRRLNRHHQLRTVIQPHTRGHPHVGAAIQHHLAGTRRLLTVAINPALLLGQVKRQHVPAAYRNPEPARGCVPQFKSGGIGLNQLARRQDLVFVRDLTPQIFMTLDGLRQRTNGTAAGGGQSKESRRRVEPRERGEYDPPDWNGANNTDKIRLLR